MSYYAKQADGVYFAKSRRPIDGGEEISEELYRALAIPCTVEQADGEWVIAPAAPPALRVEPDPDEEAEGPVPAPTDSERLDALELAMLELAEVIANG